MATDRDTALRKAEKLLRQGRLDQAIEEYVRIVEEHPHDLTSANALGDLCVRAGQVEQAVAQYARIAGYLAREGFLSKAAALYKKILKIRPLDEPTLLQAADIAARQGLLADARSYLTAVIDRRTARGDARGAAEIRVRLGGIDPGDVEASLAAARARAELGERAAAGSSLRTLAEHLRQKSRQDDARAVLQEAVRIDPDDAGARYELVTVLIALGDVDGARVLATEAQHLRDLARLLTERGDADGALAMLARAAEGDPDDGGTRASLAQAYAARGEWERAGAFLPQDVAVADPAFRLLAAEILLRVGRTGQALALLEGLADKDAGALSALAERLAAEHPGAAFTCAEVVADRAAVRQDWDAAAAALTAFVARVPHHVPALMKLVEIWVDAGLDERVTAAQAQLADAYLMSGSGNEARVIAEDLLVRNPENEAYRDRLRQTLILLGEPDPDRALTERLNGASVFVAPDLDLGDLVPHEDSVPPPQPAASDDEFEVQRHEPARQAPASILPRVSAGEDPTVERIFELSAGAIDVTSLLSEQDFAGGMGEAWDESPDAIEVDLSAALDGLQAANVPRRTHGAIPEDDLDGVFRGMRDEADRATAGGAAPEQYRRAVECEASGRDDEAVALLAQAARSPRLRFEAGGRLARLLARHGRRSQAVEWFERAAQAPAPTADAGLALLYDLGLALEGGGEWARALAIYLELQSEAGAYRDVVERVDRLSKSGMRG